MKMKNDRRSENEEMIVAVNAVNAVNAIYLFFIFYFYFYLFLFILLTRKKLITNTCYFNYENIYIYMAKNKLNL